MNNPGLLETVGPGFFSWKGPPQFGRQDLGYTPGGAQDRFSYRSASILLDQEEREPVLEMIVPPRTISFKENCFFVLTGGAVDAALSEGGGEDRPSVPVSHGSVGYAPAGSELRFGKRRYGFRTYLGCRSASDGASGPAGRARGSFRSVARWPDREGRVRVMPGPDLDFLPDPDAFFRIPWVTTEEMSEMGLRLRSGSGGGERSLQVRQEQLVSAPVCDGTVQVTPAGPIVLLRERQTTGGYPRAYVVINADVDLLSQYGPGHRIRFRQVTLDEAAGASAVQEEDLRRLRERFRR